MKTLIEYIEENLENHLAVEDYFHNENLSTLNEKYGVVEVSKSLGTILSNKIFDIAKEQKSQVVFIDSIKGYFVDRFIINLKLVSDKIIQCEYQNCLADNFYVCQLNIKLYKKLSDIPFDKFKNQIMHELLHAFEDFEKIKKKIDNSPSEEYKRAAQNLVNNPKTLDEIIHKTFYLIDIHEIDAYVQELYSYLQNKRSEISNIDRRETNIFQYAFDIIRQSKPYKEYLDVLDFIEILNSKIEISYKIINKIRELYKNYERYSNEKIIKILNKRKERIIKKFQIQVPKMVYDFIEENMPKGCISQNLEI